jgi:DNA-directed RNA polymerase subunit RPC12/RpoP
MTLYKATSKSDWLKTAVFITLFVIVLAGGAFLLMPTYWYVWALLVGGGIFLLVWWHTKTFAYRCRHCGHEFEISLLVNFISPHGIDTKGGWKYLKCPACRRRTRAVLLKKVQI